MPERVQTDSDAENQSQIGVGQTDQANRALHQINPNWVEDGHGLRGPQRTVARVIARPHPIQFNIDNQRNPPNPATGSFMVTTEDASGYAPGSGVAEVDSVTILTFDQDVFEIYDGGGGQCVVKLKTCDASCP